MRAITRKVDELGRVVIPSEYRTAYGIDHKGMVEFIPKEDGVLVRRQGVDSDKNELISMLSEKLDGDTLKRAIEKIEKL